MKPRTFSIRSRLRSFRFAWEGLRALLHHEHNARIHLAATIGVILMASFFRVNRQELLALLFAAGLVWITELFNTCVEKLMDFVSPEHRPEVKLIKDLAAGAVLVAAITALITGCVVFLPKLTAGFNN